MQIFELTQHQPVNEISLDSLTKSAEIAGRALGKKLVQAPVKALGNRVGADLLGTEKTKSPAEMMQDMQNWFRVAKSMYDRDKSDLDIKQELMGKYGATEPQANQTIDTVLDFIEKEQKRLGQNARQYPTNTTPTPTNQSGSQAFGTMAQQLGQTGTPSAPTQPTSAPAPQSPEQIRKAKQAAAAQVAQQSMTANPAITTSPAATTPPSATPNYGTSTGPGVQPQSSVFPSSYTGTSAVPTQSKPAPAPKFGAKVGPGVQPQMTATPTMRTPTAPTPTVGAAAVPVKQEPISVGGQQIKPNDPLYAKIQKQLAQQQKPAAVAESLTWSRNFDPSRTLLKKMKSQ